MTATGRDDARRVRLITDSSACLPPHEIERHEISIVPTVLVWNGEELRDGVDITNEAFWKRLATDPNLPTTSATSPRAYAAEFAKARDAGLDVLCAPIPRRISAMTDVAAVSVWPACAVPLMVGAPVATLLAACTGAVGSLVRHSGLPSSSVKLALT